MKTDAVKRALELRKTLRKDDKVLVVDFSNTLQGKDTTKVIDLMPNVATGEYLFRAKFNIKNIDPKAALEYKVPFKDVRNMPEKEIEDFVKRQEFDFPLWFKHNEGFEMKKITDYNTPFIVQVAGCNFHDGTETGGCWYCFVDNISNNGKPGAGKAWLGVDELVDSMQAARAKINDFYRNNYDYNLDIKVLRISGGEPTIVLDYALDVWRQIAKRGLDLVGQIDSNLSTGSVVRRFEKEGIYKRHILEKLAEHPVKVLTAIKGTDPISLQDNVQSNPSMKEQLYSIKRFVNAGFDIYPQMYNPNPLTLWNYLEKMDRHIENFALRVHIGPLKIYGPTTQRLTHEANRLGIAPETLIAQKKQEWDDNYKNGCDVINSYLQEYYGVGYKNRVRPKVPLKILKS
ncbi:radical SAM protein [Candidatus Woesearchaeota archaeon]|nr:radical SAM protein [Candidatus Woesearchaeota archaeon]